MASPQPLTNPYAQQPSTLPSTTPPPQAAPELPDLSALASQMSSMGATQPQAGAMQQPMAQPMDSGLPDLNALAQAVVQPDSSETIADNPTGMASVKEQLSEFVPRLRSAWGSSNDEVVGVLKQYPKLYQDVRVKNDTVEVKRNGSNKWSKLDREGIQWLGDALDLTRIGAEGAIEFVAEAVGNLYTGFAAAPLVGAGSAVTALNIGDQIAENVMQVPRDPKRSRTMENSMVAGFGAGFGWASSALARRAAQTKIARESITDTVEIAKDKIKEASESVKILLDAGVELNPKTGEVFITPNQAVNYTNADGTVPEFKIIEKELSKQPAYRNFLAQQGEAIKNGYDALINTVGKFAGKRDELGKDFQLTYDKMGDYYGQQIGMFRDMAKKELKDKPMPTTRTFEKINTLMREIDSGTQKLFGADGQALATTSTRNENIQRMFPGLTKEQSSIVLDSFDTLQKKMSNGTMSINDVDKLYTRLRKQIDNSSTSAPGKPVADALIQVKNALRDDYTDMIGQVVPDGGKEAYKAFMKNYSDFKSGVEELGGLLQSSALSRNALISKLFEGKDSLPFARSIRTVIANEDPKFWRELTTEYLQKLKNDNYDPKDGINWNAMAKKFGTDNRTGVGKEMQELILDGAGVTRDQFNSIINIGRMHQNTKFEALSKESQIGMIRKFVIAVSGGVIGAGGTARTNAAADIASEWGKNHSMMDYLKDGGWEQALKSMPGFKPDVLARVKTHIDNWTPRPVKAVAKPVIDAGVGVAKRVPKVVPKTSARKELQDYSAPESEIEE